MGLIYHFLPSPVWYLEILPNTILQMFDELPANLRNQIHFKRNGAPPRFARNVVHYPDDQSPDIWISRGQDAPISRPPRSPEFIWKYSFNFLNCQTKF